MFCAMFNEQSQYSTINSSLETSTIGEYQVHLFVLSEPADVSSEVFAGRLVYL